MLPRDNGEQVPFGYALYQRTDEAGLEFAAGFKRTVCAPVNVDFVGVWSVIRRLRANDSAITQRLQVTVASIRLLYDNNLPFTSANSAVRVFGRVLSSNEVPNSKHKS